MSKRRTFSAVGLGITVVAGVVFGGQTFASASPNTAPDNQTGPSPAATAARAQPLAPGTPCSITAKSCVDLDSQRAWLIKDGKVTRGPVNIASGGKAVGEATPVGHSLHVYLKDADHVSGESFTDGKPDAMPLSVFFESGGIAFHDGDPENASGGCIHLAADDAEAWYAYLQMGDEVQVVKASQEFAARGMEYDGEKYEFGGVRKWLKDHKDD